MALRRVSDGKADNLYRLFVSSNGREYHLYTQLCDKNRLITIAKNLTFRYWYII